jgi:hypothetical protein
MVGLTTGEAQVKKTTKQTKKNYGGVLVRISNKKVFRHILKIVKSDLTESCLSVCPST